ncbi:T9SS type A sorting domain-containing protein [Salibacter halophilus]|uniref:T9SS type A sorting domain-containing protein n=1 Tax=Salibacter halophilus TaxID=1803916 RepID=A0A6N6M9P0_9FLAO|nr:T9SS type A sorting domain-containing protein [Salibacter halophilus]KAB1065593.1 T9SS type A sorting domain-containing protein [Salibacter halophilus]
MKLLTITISMLALSFSVRAQQAVVTAGGSDSASGGSVSYTIGQVGYESYTTSNGQVSEGVQQPYEIYDVTAVRDVIAMKGVELYPNPARDNLTIEIDHKTASYTVVGMNGNSLRESVQLNKGKNNIDLSGFAQGIYFVQVQSTDQSAMKIFKVIKN